MSVASITPNYTGNKPLSFPCVGYNYDSIINPPQALTTDVDLELTINVASGNYFITFQINIDLNDATTTFNTSEVIVSGDAEAWSQNILITPEGGNFGPWANGTVLSFLNSAFLSITDNEIKITLTPVFANQTVAPSGQIKLFAIKLSDI